MKVTVEATHRAADLDREYTITVSDGEVERSETFRLGSEDGRWEHVSGDAFVQRSDIAYMIDTFYLTFRRVTSNKE